MDAIKAIWKKIIEQQTMPFDFLKNIIVLLLSRKYLQTLIENINTQPKIFIKYLHHRLTNFANRCRIAHRVIMQARYAGFFQF